MNRRLLLGLSRYPSPDRSAAYNAADAVLARPAKYHCPADFTTTLSRHNAAPLVNLTA